MYKLYDELKTSGRTPTLQDVRVAKGLASAQEVADALKVVQEKADALLAALEPVRVLPCSILLITHMCVGEVQPGDF